MKKLLSLLTVMAVALPMMAAGSASDAYLNVAKYATIDEAGAAVDGMETIYKYTQQGNSYWLTLSNYGVMKTDDTQNWFTNEITDGDTGTQYTNPWTATDVFQGPAAYFGSNTAYSAKYKMPTKTQTFYVTFCTQVKQYGYHRSNTSYYLAKMEIFECTMNADGSITDGTTAIETLQNSTTGVEVFSSSELDPEKVYKVVISNSYSYLYEIAFKTPGLYDGEIIAPEAYEVTDIGEEAAFMHWSSSPGVKSYTLRTYPCEFDGLGYREKFSNCSEGDTYADYEQLNDYTDHPEWYGTNISGAEGGIVIGNNGFLVSPMSDENAVQIPSYQKKFTLKFKAKPYNEDGNGELLVTFGANSQSFEISGPEKYYTFMIERGLNGSYDYMSTNYAFFTFKNTYYYNPYSEDEEEDHRVVITDYKVYYGDYSEPENVRSPKWIRPAWDGDTTFVYNIPADSVGFHFGYYTNGLGNQQIDMSHYNGLAYWYYDVKSVYYDGQESDWSNAVKYSWQEKWPVILEDDDDDAGENPVFGDVNGDGEVTTIDITCLYNYLLNGDETYVATSDIDGDGFITTVDITVIYNIILGE